MTPRIAAAALALAIVVFPTGTAAAQSGTGDVTLQVPLKLTQVHPDIEKVAVYCTLSSPVITNVDPRQGKLSKQVELTVSGGQVNTTVPVVFTATVENATGQTATYGCTLTGFSKSLQRWDVFSATPATAAFRLTPTPAPITGSFAW